MGYTHGTEWTDEMVEKSLQYMIDTLELRQFPSRSEIENFFGNQALTNRISKYGGFLHWAQKMNLEPKSSETDRKSVV